MSALAIKTARAAWAALETKVTHSLSVGAEVKTKEKYRS